MKTEVFRRREIWRLLSDSIVGIRQVTICTPYREQARAYRDAIAKAGKEQFWAQNRVHQLRVFTIDSFQGGQNNVVIFDLGKNRLRWPGFVKETDRINVALSRPEDMLIVIGDTTSLSTSVLC